MAKKSKKGDYAPTPSAPADDPIFQSGLLIVSPLVFPKREQLRVDDEQQSGARTSGSRRSRGS